VSYIKSFQQSPDFFIIIYFKRKQINKKHGRTDFSRFAVFFKGQGTVVKCHFLTRSVRHRTVPCLIHCLIHNETDFFITYYIFDFYCFKTASIIMFFNTQVNAVICCFVSLLPISHFTVNTEKIIATISPIATGT